MSEEEKVLEEEQISTTGTIRDKLPELEVQDTVLVIPIGGEADDFE